MLAESGHGISMLYVPSVLTSSTVYESTEAAQPNMEAGLNAGGANGRIASALIRGLKDAIARYKMSFPEPEIDFLDKVWVAYQETIEATTKPDLFELRCTCFRAGDEAYQCSCDSPILRPVAQNASENLAQRLDEAVEYDDLRIAAARDLLKQLDDEESGGGLPDSALRQVVLELRDWVLVDLPPDLLHNTPGWKERLQGRIEYLRELRMIEDLDPEHRLGMMKRMRSTMPVIEREQRLSSILRKLGDHLEHWIVEKENELAKRKSAELLGEVIVKVRTVLGKAMGALPYVMNDMKMPAAVDFQDLEKYLHDEMRPNDFTAISEYVGRDKHNLYHRMYPRLADDIHLRAANGKASPK